MPLILSGHDHNYEHLIEGNTHLVISGGGSHSLYGQVASLPNLLHFSRRTHFVLVEVYSDRIKLQAVDSTGKVFDGFEFAIER